MTTVASQSYLLFLVFHFSITHSLFHSRLKTFLFCKSFPPQPHSHITCRLTAKNRDQLRNPTLGNRVWATFIFFYLTGMGQHLVFNALYDSVGYYYYYYYYYYYFRFPTYGVTGTARIVRRAGSMQLLGVRLSVCLSVCPTRPSYAVAAGLLLWTRRARDVERLL